MTEEEERIARTAYCGICLSDVSAEDIFCLKLCGCGFCRDCLSQYVKLNIDEQTIQRLKCPGTSHSTSTKICRDEVKKLVDKDVFLAYIRQVHENEILKDPSRLFCPNSGCGAVCHSIGRLGARPIRCSSCGLKFCRLCQQSWPGRSHVCPEDLPISASPKASTQGLSLGDVKTSEVTTDQPSTSSDQPALEATPDRPVESNDVEIVVKRCPKCGVPIQRREGCAQMKCSRCGHSFCWFCMADLDRDYFMNHFESGPCRAALGHPRAAVHLYRLNAICVICGISTLALICAPFGILCSPCIVLCAPRLPHCLFPNDAVDQMQPQTMLAKEVDEDTDSEADAEDLLVSS